MRALADNLSLTACHDEETLLILTFLNEELINIYFLSLERANQTVENLIVELREERYSLEILCSK